MKNFLLLLLVIFLAIVSATLFGRLYSYSLNLGGGFSGFIIPGPVGYFVDGISRSYIFFLTLLFTAFGGVKKYWWIGIFLIPAVAFELYFDLAHIYFPIILGLAGWGIGFSVSKAIAKVR